MTAATLVAMHRYSKKHPKGAVITMIAFNIGYSFIVINLDVSTAEKAAAVEDWYRHRTSVENLFRDTKHGAALRHLPSGHPEVNRAWMWGALLAAGLTGWLHQLTATPAPDGTLLGHGVLILRLPPGDHLLAEVLARIRALPAMS